MSAADPPGSPDASATTPSDYVVAHLRRALAEGPVHELGVRVESNGSDIVLSGPVGSDEVRLRLVAEVERLLGDEGAGRRVVDELQVTVMGPRPPEEIP